MLILSQFFVCDYKLALTQNSTQNVRVSTTLKLNLRTQYNSYCILEYTNVEKEVQTFCSSFPFF